MKKTATILIAITALLVLKSCDNRAIDPFENIEGLYSVYGTLQMYTSENYVRVRRLDTPLLADSSSFNGIVTFTNLETGDSAVLQDSIVNFDGHYTHNFRVNELILPEREYKITIESPEGEVTESIASTPAQTTYQLTPNPDSPNTTISCHTEVNFQFNNVVEPEFIRMDIGFSHNGRMNWSTLNLVDQLEHSPGTDRMTVVLSPNHMLIEVFTPPLPDNPYLDLKTLTPSVTCSQLDNKQVFIRYYHVGKEWDQALPFRSGTLDIESDAITNGLGFFGAFYTDQFVIPITQN